MEKIPSFQAEINHSNEERERLKVRERRRAPQTIGEQRRKRDCGFGGEKVGRMVEGGHDG